MHPIFFLSQQHQPLEIANSSRDFAPLIFPSPRFLHDYIYQARILHYTHITHIVILLLLTSSQPGIHDHP